MKIHPIRKTELWLAQSVLAIAILLQIAVHSISRDLALGPYYLIVGAEICLALVLAFTSTKRHETKNYLHRNATILFLGLISIANISSFILVGRSLILGSISITGFQLLLSALAIFLTNIIVFALWYWEIDSPGLSGRQWSKNDKDFQFTQQDLPRDFPDWQPTFADYLYLSSTNAINFAASDTRPLSLQAKTLMGLQAMISVFTLALIVARSVNILG
ncbi:MAG TPA: hypothetical protein VFX86_01115 [Candidatus Saccharimonadales bacterium]|nr:hypothetical protein [Candidatus Saccharimonadales bacterium]